VDETEPADIHSHSHRSALQLVGYARGIARRCAIGVIAVALLAGPVAHAYRDTAATVFGKTPASNHEGFARHNPLVDAPRLGV
jgi:hypothetical protein